MLRNQCSIKGNREITPTSLIGNLRRNEIMLPLLMATSNTATDGMVAMLIEDLAAKTTRKIGMRNTAKDKLESRSK